MDALETYAEWMALHGRAIYGCTQSEFDAPPDCRYTQNGDRLYLHLFAWPFRHVHLPGLAQKVDYAQLLNDASEIKVHETKNLDHASFGVPAEDYVTLELPVNQPSVVVPVVELFLK